MGASAIVGKVYQGDNTATPINLGIYRNSNPGRVTWMQSNDWSALVSENLRTVSRDPRASKQ